MTTIMELMTINGIEILDMDKIRKFMEEGLTIDQAIAKEIKLEQERKNEKETNQRSKTKRRD